MNETADKPPVTSYIGNALGVARTLETYGLDGEAILAEVGLDVNTAASFDARVPGNLVHEALIRHIPGDSKKQLIGPLRLETGREGQGTQKGKGRER